MKLSSRPIEPKLPSKTFIETRKICTISFLDNRNGNLDYSLYDQLVELNIKSIQNLKDIYLEPTNEYNLEFSAVLKIEHINDLYELQIEKYNKDMEVFNKDLKQHEENIEARRKISNKINELQSEITKLQKELSSAN